MQNRRGPGNRCRGTSATTTGPPQDDHLCTPSEKHRRCGPGDRCRETAQPTTWRSEDDHSDTQPGRPRRHGPDDRCRGILRRAIGRRDGGRYSRPIETRTRPCCDNQDWGHI